MAEINGKDAVEAWRAAARHLLSVPTHRDTNLLVQIDNPVKLESHWLVTFDPRRLLAGCDHLGDVINTVFPYRLRQKFPTDRQQFYAHYLKAHERGRRFARNRGRWGTYFERLIAFGHAADGNQLETVIRKLGNWNRRATAALVFHTSSPLLDSPRTRGGPCWHFGELLWHADDVIDLVVVYRNHDYYNKTLGNLLALGQLLDFVCASAGKKPGKLICHSVHAYFDAPISAMQKLIDGVD